MQLDPHTLIELGLWQALVMATALLLAASREGPARTARGLLTWAVMLVLEAAAFAAIAAHAHLPDGVVAMPILAAAVVAGGALRGLAGRRRMDPVATATATIGWLLWLAVDMLARPPGWVLGLPVLAAAVLLLAARPLLRSLRQRSAHRRSMLVPLLLVLAHAALLGAVPSLRSADIGGGGLAVALAPALACVGFLLLQADAVRHAMARLARIDSLTGASNREALFQEAERLFASALRHGRSAALLRIEVDHFRRVNELIGQRGGDRLLRAIAAVMRDSLRTEDLLARLHGKAFVALLPDTLLRGARESAERLREAVAAMREPVDGRLMAATVSVGVTDMHPGDRNLDVLLERAESALAVARRGGCNRVAMYADDTADDNADGLPAAGP